MTINDRTTHAGSQHGNVASIPAEFKYSKEIPDILSTRKVEEIRPVIAARSGVGNYAGFLGRKDDFPRRSSPSFDKNGLIKEVGKVSLPAGESRQNLAQFSMGTINRSRAEIRKFPLGIVVSETLRIKLHENCVSSFALVLPSV